MNKLEILLQDTKVGILATVGKDKKPHMRWMTPAMIKDRQDVIFSITAPNFPKAIDMEAYPNVEWMFQSRALDKVISLKGKANILDNPAIKAEILEHIGTGLNVFWKLNEDPGNYIILETVIEEATLFLPMKGSREKVPF
jgi:pyridoxamine 5'-phosphate oxidase